MLQFDMSSGGAILQLASIRFTLVGVLMNVSAPPISQSLFRPATIARSPFILKQSPPVLEPLHIRAGYPACNLNHVIIRRHCLANRCFYLLVR